jgi:hypothetical protein
MKRAILALVVVLGSLAAAMAQDTGATTTDNRSAAWKQNLGLAVNDETKVTAAIQAMPEADRAAFAADVLSVLLAKRVLVADKAGWARSFAATAAALVAGAGNQRTAVAAAVAAEVLTACVSADTRELAAGDLPQLGALAKSVLLQLKGDDRIAFLDAMLAATNKQKAANGNVHKLALCTVALSLFAGAGDAKKGAAAEIFATVPLADLGAVAQAFSDAFSQRRNKLGSDDYLQAALQILQAVANRTAGLPDAASRFAYAVAAFLGGATSPATFEPLLMAKLSDLLAKIGVTREAFAAALAAARSDMAANAALMQALFAPLNQRTVWGVIILPPGNMLAGEEGPPFVHENRPPRGYQNQGIEW